MLMRKEGEGIWSSPPVTTYRNEASLQGLLAKAPELLPECDGSEAVATELEVPETGRMDLVCVSPAGTITLVECKLQSNAEIRRHIVGQVFAYAAGLWKLSYEKFDSSFENRNGSALAHCFEDQPNWDEEEFRASVAANLEAGAFSFVLAVDSITDELKRIVTYLNTHMLPSVKVLAVELKYTAGHGVEILMPQTYGEETASSVLRPEERNWSEDELMAALEESCTAQGFRTARRLFDFGLANDASFYFHSAKSAVPAVEIWIGREHRENFLSYGLHAGGRGPATVAINFDWMRPYNDESTLQRLLDRLRKLPAPTADILSDVEEKDFRRRPRLPIDEVFANDSAFEILEEAIVDTQENGHPPQDRN